MMLNWLLPGMRDNGGDLVLSPSTSPRFPANPHPDNPPEWRRVRKPAHVWVLRRCQPFPDLKDDPIAAGLTNRSAGTVCTRIHCPAAAVALRCASDKQSHSSTQDSRPPRDRALRERLSTDFPGDKDIRCRHRLQ